MTVQCNHGQPTLVTCHTRYNSQLIRWTTRLFNKDSSNPKHRCMTAIGRPLRTISQQSNDSLSQHDWFISRQDRPMPSITSLGYSSVSVWWATVLSSVSPSSHLPLSARPSRWHGQVWKPFKLLPKKGTNIRNGCIVVSLWGYCTWLWERGVL